MVKQFNWRGKFYLTCCATFSTSVFPQFCLYIFILFLLFISFCCSLISTAHGSPSFLSIPFRLLEFRFFHRSRDVCFCTRQKSIMWKFVSQNRRNIYQWQNMSISIWFVWWFLLALHTKSDKLFGSQVNSFFFSSGSLFWNACSSTIKVFLEDDVEDWRLKERDWSDFKVKVQVWVSINRTFTRWSVDTGREQATG